MVRTPSISISSTDKDKDKATQTLSSAFASMIAVGAPHQAPRNGQLKIDDGASIDSRQSRHSASSSSASKQDDERSKRRSRRFGAFSRSGRSLSPFRFGSSKRSSSANRLRINGEDDTGSESGQRSDRDRDSDTESVISSASGITPRNSAFFSPYDEDDLDASVPHSHRRQHPASPTAPEAHLPTSGSSTSIASSTHLHDDPHGVEADVESDDGSVASDDDPKHPRSSDTADADDDDEEDDDDIDPILLDNTMYNAECLTSHEHWAGPKSEDGHHHFETYEDEDLERDDEHLTAPNVVLSEDQVSTFIQRRGSKMLSLNTSRPRFERNRCTITINHGDADAAAKNSKRPKRYVVASDGSEESSYAVEWTIGTVLRDGDEMLVVSVMETDTKLDALDAKHEEIAAKMEHQRIRQAMASVLAKQATHLLERTRLEVKISCQAIHAKNARHMLLDLIDFYEPTMVVVGSRGLGSLRGILLGSTSHYLVQKSSAPVMVARKRLKLPALPRGKGDVVESVRARHMRLDQASIEKVSNADESSEAKDKAIDAEDSTPDNEAASSKDFDKPSTDTPAAAVAAAAKASEPTTPPRTTRAEETSQISPRPSISSDGSPKPQRRGSKSGHTVIPQTSLEREAETRVQIQQRKEEAAKLHEDDKRKHLFAHHPDHLRTSNSRQSDDDTDPTDEDTKPSRQPAAQASVAEKAS